MEHRRPWSIRRGDEGEEPGSCSPGRSTDAGSPSSARRGRCGRDYGAEIG